MDRRGFLGSLFAVTAAISSGVKLPSGSQVSRATRQAIDTQNRLIAALDECAIVSVSSNYGIDTPMTYEVEYVHFPGKSRKRTDDERMIFDFTNKMRPISVRFVEKAGDLTRITVEWA